MNWSGTPNPSELEPLVRAARQGDAHAFRRLYDHQKQAVYRVGLRLLGQRMDAEDVTQEVFVTIYRRLKTFDFRSSFETWCYRITVNACYDKMRKQKRRAPYQAGYLEEQEESSGLLESLPSRAEPLQQALAGDVQRHVTDGLARLHPDLRMTLVLKEIENRSYEEISDILSCSKGTVASRLARARHQLAVYLRTVGIDATYFG